MNWEFWLTFCLGLTQFLNIEKFDKITTRFIQTLLKGEASVRKKIKIIPDYAFLMPGTKIQEKVSFLF